jgi:hypothetical protein
MTRYYSATAQDTTLSSSATNSTTSIVVAATTGYPTSPFVLAIDYNASSEELVLVTAVSGLTLTVTRAYNGTTAQAHAAGAVVRHVIVAQDLTDAQNHYNASSAIHGVTGAIVGTTDTQTLTNKTLTGANLTDGGNTFPTSLATLTGTQTFTNKDLTSTTNTFGALVLNSVAFNAQTGTTYTLTGTDAYKLVTLNNAAAITLTVPSGVFTTGQYINVQQTGAGQVTIQGDGTSTITAASNTPSAPKIAAQYNAAGIICTGTNTFTVVGGLF